MKKKSTLLLHAKIINETMNYIYKYIDSPINIEELAQHFKISKFYFHKIFKEQMKINIYESIKSIRLQKASNLLLSNNHSTITQIANMCGYSSQTSFIRAFKQRFTFPPNKWRKGGYKEYSNNLLKNSKHSFLLNKVPLNKEVNIIKTKQKRLYYVKQKAYQQREIKEVWQNLLAWVHKQELTIYEEIGIYHDNPSITPASQCFYIAGISCDKELSIEDTSVSTFIIPSSLYATFDIKGKQGDMLKFIQWVYLEWLPNSVYETSTFPAHAIYKKNIFLDNNKDFEATFYLPIQLI